MKIFRGFENLPHFNGAVATMGSFDGLHAGHLELLRRVKQLAKQKSAESIVLTFDPHPRYVLGTGEGLQLLSTLDEKLFLLEREGIDNVIIIPFTIEFSRTAPADFINRNIATIGIETLVVGYNHRFGHNKEGDYDFLESQRGRLEIHRVEQQLMQHSKVSSTIIRQTIEQGDMQKAAQLLTHPYLISCEISRDGKLQKIEPIKMLPPVGKYKARIDNAEYELEIRDNRQIRIRDWNKSGNKNKALVEIIYVINR